MLIELFAVFGKTDVASYPLEEGNANFLFEVLDGV